MKTALEVTEAPEPADLAFIGESLAAFNEADVGPAERRPLVVIVRDDDGRPAAGLSGYTAWGWLYVQWLFVGEGLRGAGMAGRMLAAAEREAIARGCHGALIDTFSPVAEKAYHRQGYRVFGTLADFPKGRSRKFMQKALADPS